MKIHQAVKGAHMYGKHVMSAAVIRPKKTLLLPMAENLYWLSRGPGCAHSCALPSACMRIRCHVHPLLDGPRIRAIPCICKHADSIKPLCSGKPFLNR